MNNEILKSLKFITNNLHYKLKQESIPLVEYSMQICSHYGSIDDRRIINKFLFGLPKQKANPTALGYLMLLVEMPANKPINLQKYIDIFPDNIYISDGIYPYMYFFTEDFPELDKELRKYLLKLDQEEFWCTIAGHKVKSTEYDILNYTCTI